VFSVSLWWCVSLGTIHHRVSLLVFDVQISR
jgi:hypothetical protein